MARSGEAPAFITVFPPFLEGRFRAMLSAREHHPNRMENLSFTAEELFDEAAERARAEGATTEAEWRDVVEALLDDKREFMEIDDDEDVAQLIEELAQRYGDYRASVDAM